MISADEKRKFLIGMADAMKDAAPNDYGLNMLLSIAADYTGAAEGEIDRMKPWFEAQIRSGKTVSDLMSMCNVPRHRILFALTKLGLTAPGFNK